MAPPSVVLLHGASGNAATWQPLLPAWAWADVRALDLPGRGETPGPACDGTRAAAAWLAEELANGPPPIVVGHSYGGAVGLQLALDSPAALAGLVLVSSAARLAVHPAILSAVAAATPDAPFRLDAAFGGDTPPHVVDRYAAAAASVPPATSLADWAACDAFDVRERLGSVRCPVLVLHGGADALTIPRFQASLAMALPHGTRVALDGHGHMLPWEAPEATAAAARDWICTLPPDVP